MANIEIGGRLHSTATGNVVTGANEVLDDTKNKKQSVINAEVDETIGDDNTAGTIKGRIKTVEDDIETLNSDSSTSGSVAKAVADAKTELIGGATSNGNTLKKVEDRTATLETAVGSNGSVDQRIAAAKSEVIGDAASDYNTLGKLEDALTAETNRATTRENQIYDLVHTPEQHYVTVATYADLANISSPSDDTIYRVSSYNGNISQVDNTVYSEYGYNGTNFVFLCVKSQIDEVYDISAHHSNNTYVDLAAALDGGNNIPQELRRGGMSVKFVQSSDNKYVQCRFMLSTFTTAQFANPTNWQGEFNTEAVNDDEEEILIQDNSNNTIHSIGKNSANFKNLKSNNNDVATKNEMSVTNGTGDNADKTTIQLKNGLSATVLKSHQDISDIIKKTNDLSVQYISDDSEEIEIKSNDESSTYAKVGSYGVKSKAYLDMEGNDIFASHKTDYIRHLASNTNCPIVVFKYDDNPPEDDTLIELLDARGLKGTLACMGLDVDIYPTQAKTLGEKLHRWYLNGHGVIGHGITGGVSVLGWGGLNCMPDDDCYKQIEANIKFFETFGLPHKGLGIFNIWEYNPHTVKILGRYYDYMFESGNGMNTPDTDLYKLSAYTTDGANMLTNAKKLVDAAIGKNCIIGFGGHMTRTGKGSTDSRYCTMEQFEELLDYIAEKVNNHQMISLSIDDALELFCARNNAIGGIKSTKQYAPAVGQTYLGQNGIEVCSDEGACAIFDIAISGTVSAGTIQLSNISTTQVNTSAVSTQVVDYLEITLTDETTIEDVIGTFLKAIYREYTVRAKDSSTIRMYADIAKAMDTPSVIENTTGLTLTITRIQQGSEPTWL